MERKNPGESRVSVWGNRTEGVTIRGPEESDQRTVQQKTAGRVKGREAQQWEEVFIPGEEQCSSPALE